MSGYGLSGVQVPNNFTNSYFAPVKADSTVTQQQPWQQWDTGIANNATNNSYQQGLAASNQPTQQGWLGQGGYLQTGAQVVNALSGLAGAYTGIENLGLAKDKFAYEKGLSNVNLANQADLINQQRLNASNVGLALAGNTMTDAQKEATRAGITAGNVQRTV